MALTANTIWQVLASGAADTNAGGFDPSLVSGATGVATDLACTTPSSATPTVTSATISSVSGDVGNYIFIASGTNWTPGWYKITAQSGAGWVLDAAVGHVVLYKGTTFYNASAGTGTATTGGTFAIDYSQTGTAIATGTASSATTTVTATTSIFTPAMIGNIITDGTTNWKAITAYTSGTVVTVDSAPSWSSTAIAVGGALASPGMAGKVHVGGNWIWCSGSFTITSTSSNVSNGVLSLAAGTTATATAVLGFTTVRGDFGAATWTGTINPGTYLTLTQKCLAANLTINCSSVNNSTGVIGSSGAVIFRVSVKNSKLYAFNTSGSLCILCYATGNTNNVFAGSGDYYFCVAAANSNIGFSAAASTNAMRCHGCVSANNTGANAGFSNSHSNSLGYYEGCLSYGNGGDGFFNGNTTGTNVITMLNCRAEGNAGYGYNSSADWGTMTLMNCSAWSNTSGATNNTTIIGANNFGFLQPSSDPSVNAAGLNFSLNNTAGVGAILRAAGIPTPSGTFVLPGLSTASYPDVGPVQHQDSGGGGTTNIITPARVRHSRTYYPQRRSLAVPTASAPPSLLPSPSRLRQTRQYYPQRRTIFLPAFNASPSPIPLPQRQRQTRSYYPQKRTLILPAAAAPPSLIEAPRRLRQMRLYYPQRRGFALLPAFNAPGSPLSMPFRIRQTRQYYPQRRTPFVIPGATVLQSVPLLVRGKPFPVRYAYPMRRIPGAALFQQTTVNQTVIVKTPRVVR